MTDRNSPLTQRVRRLLGTGSLNPDALAPPIASPTAHGQVRPDTGTLFENQIDRLSAALRELYAIDRQREAELCQMREQAHIAEEHARALTETLAQLDTLIAEVNHLLHPAAEPPHATTLFERMRVRATPASEHAYREALIIWAAGLLDLRARLAALVGEDSDG